eukprot:5649925-Pyramimonas_sp.AAC.1
MVLNALRLPRPSRRGRAVSPAPNPASSTGAKAPGPTTAAKSSSDPSPFDTLGRYEQSPSARVCGGAAKYKRRAVRADSGGVSNSTACSF